MCGAENAPLKKGGGGMRVPDGAREVLRALENAGHAAYLVGGCVRDSLLAGAEAAVHDWDICAAAKPEELKAALSGYRTIDTGWKHGTLTVLLPDGRYEVTACRIDGAYSDGRHPDSVAFTDDITADLSRRDFTINAMAMTVDADGNAAAVIDPFGGREDLVRRRLRCVGDPDARFAEDALRILRALRFAARLGLTIEAATGEAMLRKRALLQRISAERLMDELSGILLAERGWAYLREYRDVLTELVPELRPCVGFAQNNPWHCHDVFDHILLSVGNAPAELTVRLALLLHDVGKPETAATDEAGVTRFRGHPEVSAAMAERILRRLRCPARLTREVVELVRFHDVEVQPAEKALRRLLNKLGAEQARRLFQVKRADTLAQSERSREIMLPLLQQGEALLERIVAEGQAFSLKDLAIDGNDLLARGVAPGPALGARLQRALDAVLDGEAENEREALLAVALRDGAETR